MKCIMQDLILIKKRGLYMLSEYFLNAFPGFLSIRNTNHQIIYLNDNFKNWIRLYSDVDPLGKTNHEIAAVVPPNVAKTFLACHDISLDWQNNCAFTDSLKKIILFEDADGTEANTKYFDVLKCGINIEGKSHIFTLCYDISDIYREKVSYIEKLKQSAFIDELTGERTFFKFKEDAQVLLDHSIDFKYALVKLDIENFKLVNKTFGLEVGNHILKTVSTAIKSLLSSKDEAFARISVDEFIVLYRYHGMDELDECRESFIRTFNELIQENADYNIKFKIGQYVIKKEVDSNQDINDFYEFVNFAHRQAKQHLDIDVTLYDEAFLKEALREKEIENKMAKALSDHEFLVFLQPKYRLSDEAIDGAEALVRWKTKDGNYIYPNDFIPILEKNGFITQLDMYMLEGACRIISRWICNGIAPVRISVNFSRQHLKNRKFVADVLEIVERFQIDPKWIEIELTETAIFDNFSLLEDILLQLHQAGFTMSMDDFGSGYSSLGLLKNLRVDVIKIDRSFFVNQQSEQRSKIVLGSVIDMAKKLGIYTVAEGVEEQVHIDLLRELGCDIVQGYFYSKPFPEEEMDKLLLARQAKPLLEIK